jgi:hypothetical protein
MELDSPSNDTHGKGNGSFFQFKSFPGRVKSSRGIGETPRASKKSESYLDKRERETFLTRLTTEDALLSGDENQISGNDSKVRDNVRMGDYGIRKMANN